MLSRYPYLIPAIIVLALSGCAAPFLAGAGTSSSSTTSSAASTGVSDVVTKPSIFDYTARSTRIPFMSPAALIADNPEMEAVIVRAQCKAGTPDPLFMVPDERQQPAWDFAGRLDQRRYFQALEYRSILTLGLVPGTVQLNTWPVELVSLSDMPQVFLEQRLAMFSNVKIPADDLREIVENDLEQQARIQKVVSRLESVFTTSADCTPFTTH
jgi:hypothetical protein